MDSSDPKAIAQRLLPPPPLAGRDKNGRFKPSALTPRSGGLKGDFARRIRTVVGDDGEALVELAWAIANGDMTVKKYVATSKRFRVEGETAVAEPEPVDVEPTIQERLDAIEFLAGYAFGKPRQAVELSGVDGGPLAVHDLSTLTLDELRAWRTLMEKTARKPGDDAIDVTPTK